ncbi:2-oxo acid dehydrogenase subunit E2 [Cryomorpha ignava]|uniref:Dihydrolipoamide acetyltransferase component of pyruvate dehydrogenase complex n=1 Tax=Cryomorpha ignava TaxID=101383 RepID=A0A7K3WVC5_9FLAO|nr:dihydrolipoamide acetyltransferase family protein [Cryomorpha ignava]NEN24862.1 2-oxo acid dehydrogenase subunit E2 [Cryomorpha ignava]
MPDVEILLPKMGESVAEATIVSWIKNEGDSVEADEPIIEIATDKVDSEVPSPEDGILVKRLCEEGDVVEVGQPIAIIRIGGESSAPAAPSSAEAKPKPAETATAQSNGAERVSEPVMSGSSEPVSKSGPSGRFYSPLVRNIAKKEGIAMNELEQIDGSGTDGRVTKKDILSYIPNRSTGATADTERKAAPQEKSDQAAKSNTPAPASQKQASKGPMVIAGPDDEIMEMDRMRKLISEHMVMSKHTSPHVTSYVEVDMTNIVTWRNKWKNKFEQREGEKLTFTPIFIEAIVKAIKDMPMVNISTDGTNIIKRKHINIGMAAALPSGNLIVPVIHDADQLNLVGLAKKVNDLANRARENKLKPEDIQGGTYTMTNVGTFGNVMGTPIINQPQAAIMAVGAIRKKPAVIETPQGDFIGIRQMMFLSHAYDHRIIDGALGGTFVRKVADYLENFDVNREI